jgi:hypothetical protein
MARTMPRTELDTRFGAFHHQGVHAGHVALVYELRPAKALGFRRGDEYSQTRWQF